MSFVAIFLFFVPEALSGDNVLVIEATEHTK